MAKNVIYCWLRKHRSSNRWAVSDQNWCANRCTVAKLLVSLLYHITVVSCLCWFDVDEPKLFDVSTVVGLMRYNWFGIGYRRA